MSINRGTHQSSIYICSIFDIYFICTYEYWISIHGLASLVQRLGKHQIILWLISWLTFFLMSFILRFRVCYVNNYN